MKFGAYEDVVHITKGWTGERLPDGRPKVSDDILRRLRNITLEEAWGPLWRAGYHYQFQGEFKTSHSVEKPLIGRAVTGVMVPKRPDLDQTLIEYGHKEEGRRGSMNQWVIDQLIEDDVVVIDLFDKIFQGTFVGGNLSTAIHTRTKRGGSVIWGGVRDLEQIVQIPDIQTYFRGNDPTGIGDVTLVGLNSPCRIGNAICLPGDIVFGTLSGVLFIPPQLAETCVIGAEKSHIRDIFAFDRLAQKVYTTAQVDTPWTGAMMDDFIDWCAKDKRAADYRHLNFDEELKEAKERDKQAGNSTQVIL
ncbi:MAG: RraA family protein [Clostridiales bacterium]|jgi:regulator of RNase E activity RraA|nr:RraA family protein [Clostridiales bacterium]